MKRRPNFSAVEMDALIDGVAESRSIVANACPVRVSKSVKEREWHAITGRVNSVSALLRTVVEVRKKWKNLRMVTKAKKEALLSDFVQLCRADATAAALKQLTPVECRVMEILESSAAATGSVDDTESQGNQSTIADNTAADAAGSTTVVGCAGIADDDVGEDEDNEDAWSGEDRPLVIDRSEIIMPKPPPPSAPPSIMTQMSLPQMQPPPLMQQLHLQPPMPAKPSILSVVEALQRRLLVVAAASPETETSMLTPATVESSTDRHVTNGHAASEAPDYEAAVQQVGDSVVGVERRILLIEERRLQLEREKVAAMREIVANLRDIARAIGAGGTGLHQHCCCHHLRRHDGCSAQSAGCRDGERDAACQTLSTTAEDP